MARFQYDPVRAWERGEGELQAGCRRLWKGPSKPTLDAEPCYEDHPRGFNATNGYFDEADVRKAAYYAVFAGGFGHTYGHHSIWSMTTEPADYFIMHWKDAILRPGASQMKHLKALIESRSFLDRVPDQSLIAAENYAGSNHMQATRGSDYAMIYCPNGLRVKWSCQKKCSLKIPSHRNPVTTLLVTSFFHDK